MRSLSNSFSAFGGKWEQGEKKQRRFLGLRTPGECTDVLGPRSRFLFYFIYLSIIRSVHFLELVENVDFKKNYIDRIPTSISSG